jgi:small conductance mechanosensitive channel
VADLTSTCGEEPGLACRKVYEWTENEGLADLAEWLVDKPLKIGLILLGAWILTRVARRLIRRSARGLAATARDGRVRRGRQRLGASVAEHSRAEARALAVQNVLGSVVSTVIWVIAVLVALGELDINLGPLIAGAGVAGVALGFGAQQLVRDYLSGLYIVIEDQFGVGDVIDLQDVGGTVEGVSLRSTQVRDVDGVLWTVANGEILKVGNKTKMWSRARIDVAIAYGADVRRAMDIVQDVAESLREDEAWADDILDDPEMWGVEEATSEGVVIRLVMNVRPGRQFAVTRELKLRVKEAFDREGIEVPPPTLVSRQDGE